MSLRRTMPTLPLLALVALGARQLAAQDGAEPADGKGEQPPAISEEEFKALHELREGAPPALRGRTVEVAGDRAYLSLPAGAAPPLAGVVVIHEWWGLNDHVRHWTDRLAAEGYAALAVDLYGGRVATTPDAAHALMKGLDRARALARLRAAFTFLREDARVRAPKVASIGWCLGGTWSLELAMAEPGLAACVLFYGRVEADPERLKAVRAPVCAIFGTRDRSIPEATVAKFERDLALVQVPHEVHRFDADHAFANPSGPRYQSEAAAQAWAKARRFLALHLRP